MSVMQSGRRKGTLGSRVRDLPCAMAGIEAQRAHRQQRDAQYGTGQGVQGGPGAARLAAASAHKAASAPTPHPLTPFPHLSLGGSTGRALFTCTLYAMATSRMLCQGGCRAKSSHMILRGASPGREGAREGELRAEEDEGAATECRQQCSIDQA